jgi:hypothetical protein
MTTETRFTLPTLNSSITYRLHEFINSLDLPVKRLDIMFDNIRQSGYGQYYTDFKVDFKYVWRDSDDCDFATTYKEDFTIGVHTTSTEVYERLRGIDEDGNYDGRVADEAEIEFIENNMDKILESIEYKLRWFFRELDKI